jgi:hypothetical protein
MGNESAIDQQTTSDEKQPKTGPDGWEIKIEKGMELMCDGGLGVCAVCLVWVYFGTICAIALAHAVVSRCRDLDSNRISTIANGTFSGLTALQYLYGAGLWGFLLSLAVAA